MARWAHSLPIAPTLCIPRLSARINNSMNIACIGLGNMGSAMATNLLKAGHTLIVFNRSRARGSTQASGRTHRLHSGRGRRRR